MNPTQVIQIFDMPRRLRSGISTLAKSLPDPSIADGNIVSEVGSGRLMSHPALEGKFVAYCMRKDRNRPIPDHVFGKAYIGNAFSAFLPRVIPLPAIGTKTVVQPRITPEQGILMDMYYNVRANFIYIIHIPAPIGTGALVEVSCPELDSTTNCLALRWKPAGVNTIAVYVPWSNDLSVVPTNSGRIGQSGGAITIRVVEDNTGDQVSTPLQVTIYQVTADVACTSMKLNPVEFTSREGLNFIPQPDPETGMIEPIEFVEHSDSSPQTIEVQGEGANDVPTQIAVDATPSTVVTSEVETPIPDTKLPAKARKTKNQAGMPGARWFELMSFTVSPNNSNVWQNLTINPANIKLRGENPSLPYYRNVWVTGSKQAGYVRTSKVKIVVVRPPQVSGLLEVQDSRNQSSRYIVEFGGNVEIPLIPTKFSGAIPQTRPRYYNNQYLRTDEADHEFRYRTTSFNRTSEVADISIRVLFKVGDAAFDVPIKPRAQASSLSWLVFLMREFSLAKDNEHEDPQLIEDFIEHSDDSEFPSEEFVAPFPGEGSYDGEIEDGGAFSEELDQDNFAVQVWEGNLPNGDITTIPLNLSVAPDLSGAGGLSPIAQKFERMAHVIPGQEGNLGPTLGRYVIELRLPTTIAGNISHVSLPGDMVDEAALYAFGLENILSMASAAMTAVGGPFVGGAIAAARPIFDIVKTIGGKLFNNSKTDTAEQPAIGGPIDVSRFINFLKPVAANEAADPTFGSLLVQARDFINSEGVPLTNIPARIWATMQDAKIERTLFNRLITPENSIPNAIYIPYDRWPHIIEAFGSHPNTFIAGTKQNECWYKFMTMIRRYGAKRNTVSLALNEILECQVSAEEHIAIESMIHERMFTVLP